MSQPQVEEALKGRSMRVSGVGEAVPLDDVAARRSEPRFRPSVKRSDEERERRHRERAIAAWLRDLSR